MHQNHFDIIIAGAGAAGISLAYRAIMEGVWQQQSILIIDNENTKAEKTWCFWQDKANNQNSVLESLVFKKWSHFSFYTHNNNHIALKTKGYQYKMIRSVDFFETTLTYLKQQKNVTFISGEATNLESAANGASVSVNSTVYTCQFLFNSIVPSTQLTKNDTYLLQHFKGYFIKTATDSFEENKIHFMDFRVPQTHGSTFVYVLPLNKREALIEYTLFSEKKLEAQEYDAVLKNYIKNVLNLSEYEILKEEFGVIPMTDFKFKRRQGNIMHIGTAGGDTRGSTGYTFNNIQKTVTSILSNFKIYSNPFFTHQTIPTTHLWFDSTILQVLNQKKYLGDEIFTDIFMKVNADLVLKFLDGETGLFENLKVMNSVKARYFIQPFFKALVK
jgi:lycopene beta-cyclase